MWAVDYVAPHHLWRGQTMIAIESSSPANAGMTARPVIQVRSISAAVALSRPKLAHETFAAAASAPGSPAEIDMVGGNGIAMAALSAASTAPSSGSRARHLGPRIGARSALRASVALRAGLSQSQRALRCSHRILRRRVAARTEGRAFSRVLSTSSSQAGFLDQKISDPHSVLLQT